MRPTEILRHEHRIVEKFLDAAESEAISIQNNGTANIDKLEKILDFFKNFTDKCHHGKEENHLFPMLESRGLPHETGPIAVMLYEHEVGRAHIQAISHALEEVKNGNNSELTTISINLLEYVDLLRGHINKEDNILFVMAERFLTNGDEQLLLEAFDKVEREEMGEGVHEHYHQMAHEI